MKIRITLYRQLSIYDPYINIDNYLCLVNRKFKIKAVNILVKTKIFTAFTIKYLF